MCYTDFNLYFCGMRKTLLLTLFTLITSTVFCQGWMPQGARSSSLGHASVALVDLFSFHHNPGALGFMKTGGAAVTYENRYLLRELQSQGFVVAQPLKSGVVSLGGQFYGYEQFRTARIGGGYSMQLADNFSAGVQLNYMNLRLDPFYGARHALTAEFGMLLKVNDKLNLGFSVLNLGRTQLSEFQDDRFSTILRLGAAYQISEHLLLVTEISKDITYSARLRGGMEYSPNDQFFLRIGAQGAPVEFTGGIGVKWDRVMLDLGTNYHQILGWTPSISMLFHFQSEK